MAADMWSASAIWTYCMEGKKAKDLTVDDLEDCVNNFVELQADPDVPSHNIVQAFQRFMLDVNRVVERTMHQQQQKELTNALAANTEQLRAVTNTTQELQQTTQQSAIELEQAMSELTVSQKDLADVNEALEETEIELLTVKADHKDEVMKLKDEMNALKIALVTKERCIQSLQENGAATTPQQQPVNVEEGKVDGMPVSTWLSLVGSTYDISNSRRADRVVQERLDSAEGTHKAAGEHVPNPIEELKYFQDTRRRIYIRKTNRGNTSSKSMKGAIQEKKRFDKEFAEPGESFDTMDADSIVKKYLEHVLSKTTDDKISSNSYAHRLQQIERLLKVQGRFTSFAIDRLRKDVFNMLKAESKEEKLQEEKNGCHPMTHKDLLHMLHTIIGTADGHQPYLDFELLQAFVACQISNQTSRRFSEVFSISLQSLRLERRTIKKPFKTPPFFTVSSRT